MHRLASRILAVVALFVLGVTGVLIARSRSARLEPVGPSPSSADLAIKEVQVEEEAGGVRWQLTADQALIFEGEGRTTLRNVKVRVHDGTRSWTIVGQEGDLFQRTKDVEVRRDVVMTSSDGLKLETTVLRWRGAEKRLWTDQPVTITRPGAVVRGTALDVDMAEEATTVGGRVHATFTRGGRG